MPKTSKPDVTAMQIDVPLFDIFEAIFGDDNKKKSKALEAEADLIDDMLNSESLKERLEMAKAFTNDPAKNYGVAYLVLARESESESASGQKEQEKNYRAAIEAFTKELNKSPFPYRVSENLTAAVTIELANTLWNSGRTDEAIELVKAIDTELLSDVILDKRLFTYLVYLVCTGAYDEAQKALEADQLPTEEWLYFNALLKYKAYGDSAISRSALTASLTETESIASWLTRKLENIDTESYLFSDMTYADLTRVAWEATDGALEWLAAHMEKGLPRFGESEIIDEIRLKKWQREFDMGESHVEREDIKAAKRAYKNALKEAEQLNDGGEGFNVTCMALGALLLETDGSLDELVSSLDKRIEWLDSQDEKDFDLLARNYYDLADTFLEIGEYNRAERCATKAVKFFERTANDTVPKIDHFEGTQFLEVLALALEAQDKYSETKERVEQLISMKEKFLGKKHLSLVDYLKAHKRCLHELNQHKEEQAVLERLIEIDGVYDLEEEGNFECKLGGA